MNAFFAPGFALLGRIGVGVTMASISALYVVAPVAVLYLESAGTWAAAAGVAAILAAFYLSAAHAIWTRSGMARLSNAAERVASGDLSFRVGLRAGEAGRTDAGRMWNSMGRMSANLGGIVSQVRSSAEAIARGAREVGAGYQSLSERTERQASTLEETASGMEQMAATVKQNAANCRRASELAREASGLAEQSAQNMRAFSAAMQRIETSSKSVTDIVGVIEGIAFQTNILALNAAVESARAGEQGRGFAVVAGEVRNLAQRSAAAAKEIKGLIGASAASVTEGAQHAGEASDTIARVVGAAQEAARVIGEIATASGEQSTGVEEIDRALSQLEAVTQQNAALVEQTGAAALGFESEAARLIAIVDSIKLDRGESREKAVAMVKRAVAHLRRCGAGRALADFSNPRGAFVEDDLYIVVLDFAGVVRANGGNPSIVGQNHWERVDIDGKKQTQEIVGTARSRGLCWVEYRWPNPKSGKVESKSTYCELVDELVIGCGVYGATAPAAARPGAPRLHALPA